MSGSLPPKPEPRYTPEEVKRGLAALAKGGTALADDGSPIDLTFGDLGIHSRGAARRRGFDVGPAPQRKMAMPKGRRRRSR